MHPLTGITLDHPHCIASIDAANKIVSLQEPIHVDLPYREGVKYQLQVCVPHALWQRSSLHPRAHCAMARHNTQEISPVTNVGVELLRFESGTFGLKPCGQFCSLWAHWALCALTEAVV